MYEWSGMGEVPNEFDNGRKKKIAVSESSPPTEEPWIVLDEQCSLDEIAEEGDRPALRRKRPARRNGRKTETAVLWFTERLDIDTLCLQGRLNIRSEKIRRMDPNPDVEYDWGILWGE
jgi:hypothetical protein